MNFELNVKQSYIDKVAKAVEKSKVSIENVDREKDKITGWGTIKDIESLASLEGVYSVNWSNY